MAKHLLPLSISAGSAANSATNPAREEYGIEQKLFNALDPTSRGYIYKNDLLAVLQQAGIHANHLFMQATLQKLTQLNETTKISFANFLELTHGSLSLLEHALTGGFIIPDFANFCADIEQIYHETLSIKEGKLADYIPQLARVNPDFYGISLCTIDGQMYSIGDSEEGFSLQSTCKPINYCLAQREHGEENVHRYIGKEPSGRRFNVLRLNKDNVPHNPFINAGAIMACSLIRPDLDPADRFDYTMQVWEELCGGVKPGFNNAVYLSEKNTADRNFAIGHFMREKKAFPPNVDLKQVLEFYFQCCSIEMDTKRMAVVAATLANAGVCPLTQKQIFEANTVKNCLSLMYSCGLYDFTGEFAFSVGLPAKSGVSGAVLLVIPNVLGICVWSPPLDKFGNSVRGITFCKKLIEKFNFHNYDSLVRNTQKQDPRRQKNETKLAGVMSLIWAASQGDLEEIKRLLALGVDLNDADYDGRTALHLAASEGQVHVVRYLLAKQVTLNPVDRWGGTPLVDAYRGHHREVIELLEQNGAKRNQD